MWSLEWGMFAVLVLFSTQIVIALVTVYFHRAMAHQAVSLHPRLQRLCRFLAWFMIAMDPKQFAAVHRKHHAKVDGPEDPHAPVRFGLGRVLWGGLGLYRTEAHNPETMARYGRNLPSDPWDERLYERYPNAGFLGFGLLALALLGWQGALWWGLHALWIPLWAAGVINGLGHAVGYRRFATADKSTNLVPWGVWIGGEELHNNHHAYPASPKFSSAWYEVDAGWGLICLLQKLGLATARPIPTPLQRSEPLFDARTLRSLRNQRAHWLAEFHRATTRDLKERLTSQGIRHWGRISALYATPACPTVAKALHDPLVATMYALEQKFLELLNTSSVSWEALATAWQEWLTQIQHLDMPHVKAWCDAWLRQAAPEPLVPARP